MSAVKTYYKEETKLVMLGLEHPKPTDFYLSVWQSTRSAVPLLIFRAILFCGTLGIVLASIILYGLSDIAQYWLIFLTHWGLTVILFTTGFATLVSARIYLYGPISSDCCLPWYVKTYWVLYNIANPIAYLITIFYWTVLYEAGVEEELSHGLDIAVHGLNTVVMLLLLFSSSHSGRLLHVHHPFLFGIGWVIFSVIYYLAGGVNTKGERYIYPVINWSNPGTAILVVLVTGILLVVLHLATIGLASLRDAIATRWCRPSVIHHVEEGTPLRQQTIYQPTTMEVN